MLLSVLAAASFAFTATLAGNRRAAERHDAVEWFRRAEAARAAGNAEQATAALRRAVSMRPGETAYVLSLAEVLTDASQFEAATRALMRLRADAPDDPEINRAIARVAAKRHDITAAVRYYHNALYGPWPSAAGPRGIRLELIRFLLDNGETKRAVSELIAATTDLPASAGAHRELAQLFAEAGEPARAFDFFSSALRLSPDDPLSVEGAVATAFTLGDYSRVASYTLPSGVGAATRERAQLSALVIANDPLAPRIGVATRRRRLATLAAHVAQRAATCGQDAGAGAAPPVTGARSDRRSSANDTDISEWFEALVTENAALDARCPSTPLDRAIALIARQRGINQS